MLIGGPLRDVVRAIRAGLLQVAVTFVIGRVLLGPALRRPLLPVGRYLQLHSIAWHRHHR